MREDDRGLFPGAIEMMVLQLLRSGPMHGYLLVQIIKRNSDGLLEVEEGSLYPALQRMLKLGWVTAEWKLSERNRRIRVYRITRVGRKQLEQKVSAFDRVLRGIVKVMRPSES